MFQLFLQAHFYGLKTAEITATEKYLPEAKEFNQDKRVLNQLLEGIETETYLYPAAVTN